MISNLWKNTIFVCAEHKKVLQLQTKGKLLNFACPCSGCRTKLSDKNAEKFLDKVSATIESFVFEGKQEDISRRKYKVGQNIFLVTEYTDVRSVKMTVEVSGCS